MHYQQAIAQLRALGFMANKIGRTLKITLSSQPGFEQRFFLDENGMMPQSYDRWLELLKPKPTIADFTPGTSVRHKSDPNGVTWLITENFGDRATGVATQDFTNPDEWEIVK